MTTLKKDTTVIGKLIDIMRPAVVKLITDTTIVIILQFLESYINLGPVRNDA